MKAKIAIASTLKPVIDPRAFEKIGKSLASDNDYEVHILGAMPTIDEENIISLHPLTSTKGFIQRFIKPWKILRHLNKIKPDLLIITTHELLVIGALYKIINGIKLIYDIQENYYFNLIYQKNYLWGVRHLLAYYVRTKELLLTNVVDHFLLAEQCYADEIKFIRQQFTVLENKFLPQEITLKKETQAPNEFLISGTISKEYGVFEALYFFKQFPADKYKLIIIGHCPNRNTLSQLKKEVKGIENIEFLVSLAPIPHQDILAQIGDNTIGLLPYQINKSTMNKIPTKLYEYIGWRIPLLISPNPIWYKLVKSYQAGCIISFQSPANIDHISQCITSIRNGQDIDLKDIMWRNEKTKLLNTINGLLLQ